MIIACYGANMFAYRVNYCIIRGGGKIIYLLLSQQYFNQYFIIKGCARHVLGK